MESEGEGDRGVVGFDMYGKDRFWLSTVAGMAVKEDSSMLGLVS